MMTAAMSLLTVGCIALWWKKSRWAWWTVVLALVIGVVIFVQDVDFSSNLGIQL